MNVFAYTAFKENGQRIRGNHSAETAREVRDFLRAEGMSIESVGQIATRQSSSTLHSGSENTDHKITAREITAREITSENQTVDPTTPANWGNPTSVQTSVQGNTQHSFGELDSASKATNEKIERAGRGNNLQTGRSLRAFRNQLSRRAYHADVTRWISEMGTLLSVGIPVTDALDTLTLQSSRRFRVSLLKLKNGITSGSSLAESMEMQDDVFDTLSVSMVKVGEQSGELDIVLKRLATFRQQAGRQKDKLITSLTYPAIVVTVGFFVGLFLMTYVIPTLLVDLQEAGRPLPWPTMVLKGASDHLATFWPYHLFAVAIAGAIGVWMLSCSRGQRLFYSTMTKTPVLGQISILQELSRFSLVVATLMKSGISFVHSVKIAQRTCCNPLIRDSLDRCLERVSQGSDIGAAFQQDAHFPPLFVHVFTVGQQSGQLESMLEKISRDYSEQVDVATNRMTSILEPTLIVALTLFVGFLLFATMLPILEAGNVQ